MRNTANTLAATTTWKWRKLSVGPAGFCMGWREAADSSWQMQWNDVGGGYRRASWADEWGDNILMGLPSSWLYPLNQTNVVSGVGLGPGIYDADISASNTAYGYMAYAGRIFQTNNRGAAGSWTEKTAFTPRILLANSAIAKHLPGRLVVDPSDHLSVFFGLPDEQPVRTRDGFTTAPTAIASLPAVNAAVYQFRGDRCVLFCPDHTSALIGGRRSKWTAAVMGAGLYESTDAGETFTAVAGSPKHVTSMCYDGLGRLYFMAYGDTYTADAVNPTTVRGAYSGANSGAYYRESGTTVGPLTGLGFSNLARYVAVSPTNNNDIMFADGSGLVRFTSTRPTSATLTSWGSWSAGMITTIAKKRPMIAYEREIQLGVGSHNAPRYSADGTKIGIPGGYTFMYLVRSEVPASQIAWLKLYEDGAGSEVLVAQGGMYAPA